MSTGVYFFGVNGYTQALAEFMSSLGFVKYEPDHPLDKNHLIFVNAPGKDKDTDTESMPFAEIKRAVENRFGKPFKMLSFFTESIYVPVAEDKGEPLTLL